MFAIDASVIASWCFPDEDHPDARAALERIASDPGIAPALLWFELRNVLLMGERQKRLTSSETAQFLNYVKALPLQIDNDPNGSVALEIARKRQLSFYDAVYLELALRRSLPLATLDGALKRACAAEKVPLIGTA